MTNLRVVFPVIALLLGGCASVPVGPTYYYNEVVVLNQSRYVVRDVQISATNSGRVFGCGNIAPRGICSNKFRPQVYRGSPVRVTWGFGETAMRSEFFELALPPSSVAELPLRGVLVIGANGSVQAYLQQDKPGPHL